MQKNIVRQSALAIINPISGIGSKKNIPLRLKKAFQDEKWEVDIVFTEAAGHATELAKQAIADGRPRIVAVGGDGTINEIGRALVYSKTELAVIPCGSGNGLARDLHIPMDTGKAIKMAAQQKSKLIDACQANEHIFFCTCGVGFDAQVSHRFAQESLRGPLTYVKDGLEELLKFKPQTYRLQIGEKETNFKAFLITCANASQYGNNAYIAPKAFLDDGWFDLTILKAFTPFDIGPLAIQLFTKQIDKNGRIQTFKAQQATIWREEPGPMHIDGEAVDAGCKIDLKVLPSALSIVAPTTFKRSLMSIESYSFMMEMLNTLSKIR
ncbi:MAG: diacylglycerol kinase family lipid kinase [Massilibacteroides sp.]|nr:diacylglycerol kinase family lipid kinase [Massilibacteroides sp.]